MQIPVHLDVYWLQYGNEENIIPWNNFFLEWRKCKKKQHTQPFSSTYYTNEKAQLLGLVSLNPIVWCYVWHYVWLNVLINKVVLLLSKIMVTWIFRYYQKVHEMHSMWFSHRRYKSQVLCKLRILVHSRWWNWAFHLWWL